MQKCLRVACALAMVACARPAVADGELEAAKSPFELTIERFEEKTGADNYKVIRLAVDKIAPDVNQLCTTYAELISADDQERRKYACNSVRLMMCLATTDNVDTETSRRVDIPLILGCVSKAVQPTGQRAPDLMPVIDPRAREILGTCKHYALAASSPMDGDMATDICRGVLRLKTASQNISAKKDENGVYRWLVPHSEVRCLCQ